jgi:hypothetical protein
MPIIAKACPALLDMRQSLNELTFAPQSCVLQQPIDLDLAQDNPALL